MQHAAGREGESERPARAGRSCGPTGARYEHGSAASQGRGVRKQTSDPAPGARSGSWSEQGQAVEGLRTHRRGGARRTARRHQRLRHTPRGALEHSSGHGPHRPSPFRSKRHARAPRPAGYVSRPLGRVADAVSPLTARSGWAGRDGRPVGAGCSAHQEDASLPASRCAVGARRRGGGWGSPLGVASGGVGWP
jgi:hypothetical protein